MSKKIVLLYLFLFTYFQIYAQVTIKGTISGYSNNQVIDYFPPIGEYANTDNYIITTKINNNTFNLNLDIHTQVFIKVRIATEPLYLLVKPGDTVILNIKNTKNPSTFLKISGANASADYWYNIYMYNPGAIFAPHDSLLNMLKTHDVITTSNAIAEFVKHEYSPLDSLYRLKQIDDQSLILYKRQIETSHFSIFINELNGIYENTKDENVSLKVTLLKKNIYKIYDPLNPDNLKVMFGINLFLFSDVKEFINPLPIIDTSKYVFGVYNQYLLLPSFFTEDLLGVALLTQKRLSVNEFNFDKGYAVFKKKFPNSAYLTIIDKYVNKETVIKTTKNRGVIIDSVSNYATLKEIINKNKGKALYIDLWATWCIPCRQEFPYYTGLKEDFRKHDIKLIFISIDQPITRGTWKNVVVTSNLQGTHYIVNVDLMKNIKNLIYHNNQIVVPRYVLINKLGEIINVDAPRPSEKADLINLLDKKL